MLVCQSAQALALSSQICSSITNRPMRHLSAAYGTSPPLMLLCRDTLQHALCRRVNKAQHLHHLLRTAQAALKPYMLWLLFNAISTVLRLVLTALPGSLGKEVAKAVLEGRQGCRKPTGANLLPPSCRALGQTVLVQDGNSLAAGQHPALPGTFTSPEKSQVPPAQARWDVTLMLSSS